MLPVLLALTLSSGGAGEHLLAGAEHFRAGRHAEALVEFRVAARLGAPDANAYAGAALVALGRPEDAVEAFAAAPAAGEDPLLAYHRALACHGARLYGCADVALAAIGDGAGPRVAAEVKRLRAEIAAALRPVPAPATIDWYLARCEVHRGAGRAALATAFCREAAALAARRPDGHGAAMAAAGLAAARAEVAP